MDTRMRRATSVGLAGVAIAGVVAVTVAFGATSSEIPGPVDQRPSQVVVEPVLNPMSPEDEAIAVEAREAARIEAERVAAEQAAAAETARVEAERVAAEAAAQQVVEDRTVPAENSDTVEGAGPAPMLVKCPRGSTANSGDGGNDTSCLPDMCFHIVLPDPAHPECATPFRP